jgi:chemotaxis protein MotB
MNQTACPKFTFIRIFTIASLLFCFASCKTGSPLYQKLDHFFQTKRYKAAVAERDTLRKQKAVLMDDTLKAGEAWRKLNDSYNQLSKQQEDLKRSYQSLVKQQQELTKSYQALEHTSGTKLAALARELEAKSKDLNGKEELMARQELKLKEMQDLLARQDSVTSRLNAIVKDALLGFKSDELSVKVKNGKVYVSMSDKLLFKSGSASVESKGKEALQKLGDVLNKNQDIEIFIEGHTDNVPIRTSVYKDNWDLSVARATNIVRMLIEENKLNPKRLTASGKGEYFPVASNESAEGRAKNRRTEIILSPKLDELFDLLQKKK